MPDGGASIWGPMLIGGLTAGGEVASAAIGAHSAHEAADQQLAAANQARAYQQQATAQAQNLIQQGQAGIRYAPTYGAPQGGAYSALGQAMGFGGSAAVPATSSPYQPAVGGMAGLAMRMGGTPQSGTNSAAMVQMRAPTGEVSSVPSNLVAHYRAKGAQLV